MNQLTTANDAHARHRRIVELRDMGETIFLQLGKELYEFEKHRDYAALGYASFNSYLADPDVDISPRTAYRLKAVYSKYILEMSLPPEAVAGIGYTKLSMISSQVTSDNAEEWLVKAGTLSRSDIIRELKDNDVNYQEPPIVRLLDWMHLGYAIGERSALVKLEDVKLVQQGVYVTVTGTLVQNNDV